MLNLFLLVWGFFVGSFLGVLVDRIPRGEGFATGRSYCEHCGHVLGALDLIPVLSFILLRGKCRYCHTKLSPYYIIIELTTGILFALSITLLRFTNTAFLSAFLVIISGLIVVFFTDLKYGIIPDKILIPGVLVALVWVHMNGPTPPSLLTGFGCLAFFGAIYLFTKGRGMGFGDVKFSFLLGLLLGFPAALFGLYIAFISGAVVSIALVAMGRKKLKSSTVAFGPFLVIGILVNMYFPAQIHNLFFKLFGIL